MEYCAKTDIGNKREKNEDFFYAADNLFIVADGMGGHKAGEIASKTAVEAFVKYFYRNSMDLTSEEKQEALQGEEIKKLLTSSISYAHEQVLKISGSSSFLEGMGTTLTGCYLAFKNKIFEAHIIHAGDSRLYLKSGRDFTLVTEDHTIVGKMYRDGLITYEQAFSHPLKNYLENVIGIEADFKSDYIDAGLNVNDVLVLCSDGLNSMIKDIEINRIITRYKNPGKITDALIEKAKANGGDDNITVITIRI